MNLGKSEALLKLAEIYGAEEGKYYDKYLGRKYRFDFQVSVAKKYVTDMINSGYMNKAFENALFLSQQNNAVTMYQLWLYRAPFSEQFTISEKDGIGYLIMSAELGYPDAQAVLSVLYNDGVDLGKDRIKAEYWARKVLDYVIREAESGTAQHQMYLAKILSCRSRS